MGTQDLSVFFITTSCEFIIHTPLTTWNVLPKYSSFISQVSNQNIFSDHLKVLSRDLINDLKKYQAVALYGLYLHTKSSQL